MPRTLSDADRGVNLNSEDVGERGDAPACRVCRVPAIAQQGSTSATHLTHCHRENFADGSGSRDMKIER